MLGLILPLLAARRAIALAGALATVGAAAIAALALRGLAAVILDTVRGR